MKLNICYIVDDDLHEFSDFFTNALKKEHTAHQISSTLPIGEIKQQLAKISKLHLVIVLLSTYNKKLLQMLIMTKKKNGVYRTLPVK